MENGGSGAAAGSARFPVGAASYHNLTVPAALKAAERLLDAPERAEILFLNIDSLRLAAEDSEFRAILERAALVLPDGIGIRLATRAYGGRLKANCNGTDLTPRLVAMAAQRGIKVFLLGATEPVVRRAAEVLVARYPGLVVAGTHHGYFEDPGPVIAAVNASGAGLLLVGMGAPRQEKWIARHRALLAPPVCVGVGNLFTWISGAQPRAPVWVRRLALEWAWRILLEPRRLFSRYVLNDMPFLIRLAAARPFSARAR